MDVKQVVKALKKCGFSKLPGVAVLNGNEMTLHARKDGHAIIVLDFSTGALGGGWELFVTPSSTNDIEKTFEALDKILKGL